VTYETERWPVFCPSTVLANRLAATPSHAPTPAPVAVAAVPLLTDSTLLVVVIGEWVVIVVYTTIRAPHSTVLLRS